MDRWLNATKSHLCKRDPGLPWSVGWERQIEDPFSAGLLRGLNRVGDFALIALIGTAF